MKKSTQLRRTDSACEYGVPTLVNAIISIRQCADQTMSESESEECGCGKQVPDPCDYDVVGTGQHSNIVVEDLRDRIYFDVNGSTLYTEVLGYACTEFAQSAKNARNICIVGRNLGRESLDKLDAGDQTYPRRACDGINW